MNGKYQIYFNKRTTYNACKMIDISFYIPGYLFMYKCIIIRKLANSCCLQDMTFGLKCNL